MVVHRCSIYSADFYRIGNLAHAIFAGHFFRIPLKYCGGGEESFTEEELYEALASIFAYVFLDLDTATSFQHSVNATKATKKLGDAMTPSVTAAKNEHFSNFRHMMGITPTEDILKEFGTRLIDRLFEGGKSIDEVVWTIIPTAAAAAATQAQGVSSLLDVRINIADSNSGLSSLICTCLTSTSRIGQQFESSPTQMHLKISRN